MRGCTKEKSTTELKADLKSGQGRDKLSAARTLAEKEEDPAKVIPSLIEALKDKSTNVRKSSIIALGALRRTGQGRHSGPASTAERQ